MQSGEVPVPSVVGFRRSELFGKRATLEIRRTESQFEKSSGLTTVLNFREEFESGELSQLNVGRQGDTVICFIRFNGSHLAPNIGLEAIQAR